MSYLRRPFRTIRRRLRDDSPPKINPAFSTLLRKVNDHLERGELTDALDHAMLAAGVINHDNTSSIKLGKRLIALGAVEQGSRLILDSERRRIGADAWTGEKISDHTLLIDWPTNHLKHDIGFGIASLNYIGHAARLAKRCIVIVEPRLVALYRRTLENVQVYAVTESTAAIRAQADAITSLQSLEALFGGRAFSTETFMPMRADPSLIHDFRRSYAALVDGRHPLIGLSWGSKVTGREAPPFDDWAEFMRLVPANFVSLQYGAVTAAVKRLRTTSQKPLIYDSSVDQFVDMDRFAAQVATLDAVVTINNTIAHTAGALNVPAVVILGNNYTDWHARYVPQGGWSRNSTRYPKTVLVQKDGKSWKGVMNEVRSHLASVVSPID
jgi:hypothetical protein